MASVSYGWTILNGYSISWIKLSWIAPVSDRLNEVDGFSILWIKRIWMASVSYGLTEVELRQYLMDLAKLNGSNIL